MAASEPCRNKVNVFIHLCISLKTEENHQGVARSSFRIRKDLSQQTEAIRKYQPLEVSLKMFDTLFQTFFPYCT
jgi:hypothetical protein